MGCIFDVVDDCGYIALCLIEIKMGLKGLRTDTHDPHIHLEETNKV